MDEQKNGEVCKGEVIWFNVKRGYGFIRDEYHSDDVFVHYSKIEAPLGEFRALEPGDLVEYKRFVVDRDERQKVQARDVVVTGQNPDRSATSQVDENTN